MHIISETTTFGGKQFVFEHHCVYTNSDMQFAMFIPNYKKGRKLSAGMIYLSGLTCTWENVMIKSGIQRAAAECNMIIIAPDTSPRGKGVADDPATALGQGASFYLNATEDPWKKNYQMCSYIVRELPNVAHGFESSLDLNRLGIMGHSMGGHGALTIGIKHQDIFRSISAFAPICNPTKSPWGKAALKAYLGDDKEAWARYDACALLETQGYDREILVDQGGDDEFLNSELNPDKLHAVCKKKKIPLQLNLHLGYDHSYYFVASFMEKHINWHFRVLNERS